ncbi:unnamed protein product [Cuscuta epithymum]|uniref:Methyltransferase type 11 domain-containing protein n=2 Tax=Cuscuta epithymum TaxID=186058 RepID=A0AAV0EJN2_9ASTE|nr:unnamed protein product [Cuscuta epithymum]
MRGTLKFYGSAVFASIISFFHEVLIQPLEHLCSEVQKPTAVSLKHPPNMYRDEPACNTYNYGDALYWDARYIQEAGVGPFDWYQRYSSLRPFVRKYVPTSSRVLMVGCGNAVMSEEMVKDGYVEIVNVDISSVAIDMMRKKYEHVGELQYMQMDVRDMSLFPDDSFDSVIDKGTLDSLMCGTNAPISACQMLGEVNRILKPGGVYML